MNRLNFYFIMCAKDPCSLHNTGFNMLSFHTEESIWHVLCKKSHYPPGNHYASPSKNVLFPGHNHLLTTGADDSSLKLSRWCSGNSHSVGSSAPVVSRCLWTGNRTFLRWLAWWLVDSATWIVPQYMYPSYLYSEFALVNTIHLAHNCYFYTGL